MREHAKAIVAVATATGLMRSTAERIARDAFAGWIGICLDVARSYGASEAVAYAVYGAADDIIADRERAAQLATKATRSAEAERDAALKRLEHAQDAVALLASRALATGSIDVMRATLETIVAQGEFAKATREVKQHAAE